MSIKRTLDYDPITGITNKFEYDPINDLTILHTEQDVTKFVEAGKTLQNDDEYSKAGIKKSWWHYAIIPNIVSHKWLIEEGINIFDKNHEKKVFQKLNSPEYRYLKTTSKMHR